MKQAKLLSECLHVERACKPMMHVLNKQYISVCEIIHNIIVTAKFEF